MGANLNPQQLAFKENYTNPASETFGNAKRSAIRAGYSEDYADTITAVGNEWVSEILRDTERLQKAEKVLDKTLDMIDDEDFGKQRLAQDTAKFVAKGLGKQKYGERIEQTGADGKELSGPVIVNDIKLEAIREKYESEILAEMMK